MVDLAVTDVDHGRSSRAYPRPMTDTPSHVTVEMVCHGDVPAETLHWWSERLMGALLDIEKADGGVRDPSVGSSGATNTITVEVDMPNGGPLTAVARAVTAVRGAGLGIDGLLDATVATAVNAAPNHPDWDAWRERQWQQVSEALPKLAGATE